MKKRLISCFLTLGLMFGMVAISPSSVLAEESSTKEKKDPIVRTGVAMPTSTSANIVLNNFRYFDDYDEVGIMYSTDKELTQDVKMIEARAFFSSFSAYLKDLEPSTTYYYRAFVNSENGQVTGEKRSFKTLASINVTTGNAVSVTSTTATIEGNKYKNILLPMKSGIGYSTTETDDADDRVLGYKYSNFSTKLKDLQPNTTYYYYTFVYNVYGKCYKGEVKSFTTSPQ